MDDNIIDDTVEGSSHIPTRRRRRTYQSLFPLPDFTAITPANPEYNRLLHYAMTYSSVELSIKDAKRFTLDWLTAQDRETGNYQQIREAWFQNVGKYCWVMQKGGELDDKTRFAVEKMLVGILSKADIADGDESPKRTVQDYIRRRTNDAIAQIDEWMDHEQFDNTLEDWMKSNDVTSINMAKIRDHYQRGLDDILAFLDGTGDPQLMEAYGALDRKYLVAESIFLKRLCGHVAEVKRKIRKSKPIRPVSAERQVKKLKYLERDADLGISSVSPTKIIGAHQLWVFNVKYRTLGCYKALADQTLAVRGCTVLNFDPETSIRKKIRKPPQVIAEVLAAGKVELRTTLDKIRATDNVLNGRINSDTLLLRTL